MPGTYKVVLVQLAVTVFATLAFWLWQPEEGQAALMGGLAMVVPNAFFARVTAQRRSAASVLVNGAVKFLLGIVLIAVAMKWFQPPPFGFFTALIAVMIAHALGGALIETQSGTPKGASQDLAR